MLAHFSSSAPRLALSTACSAVRAATEDGMPAMRRIARRLNEAALYAGWTEAAELAQELALTRDPAQALELAGQLEQHLITAAAARSEPAPTILMVEDDVLTTRVHSDILAADGHTIVATGSTTAARRAVHERDIGVVLLDLVLPHEDGRELLSELRSDPAMHAVPVIVLTSRPDVITQAECFCLGADAYLVKPVPPEVLRAAVAAALDLSAARRSEGRVDRLTGLPNRTALLDALERAAALARQTGRPLGLAMIDLDHFKSVNDTYGHAVGDDVLRGCAASMRSALRVSDLIARWGGEEFCVILPDTPTAGAGIALDKTLRAVRDLVFGPPAARFGVTFSAGVVEVDPALPLADALEAVDALLYRAKSSGRNRVLTTASAAASPRPQALVADDDVQVLRVISRVLESQGFQVISCADGVQALQLAQDGGFAIAVLDVEMPRLSGFDTLKALRDSPLNARLPVLMLTGSSADVDVARGFELGASDYMSKPFRNGEFIARIRRLLNRR